MERWSVDLVSGRMDRRNGFEGHAGAAGVCACVYMERHRSHVRGGAARGFVCCLLSLLFVFVVAAGPSLLPSSCLFGVVLVCCSALCGCHVLYTNR